jgi:hypothetical protein
MAIVLDVCDSWHITKQKKIEKIKYCLTTKSPPLSYCSGFIFNEKITMYIVFIAQKMKKKLNGFSTKKFKIWNGLRFHLCKSISFNTKTNQKLHQQP